MQALRTLQHCGTCRLAWPGLCPISSRACSTPTHYEVLGIAPTAAQQEVQAAWKRAAKQWHPDLHQAGDATAKTKFSQSMLAYQVLSEPDARRCYDLSIDKQQPAALRAASKVAAFRCAAVLPRC